MCQIFTIALKTSRLAQEILENSRKLEKELKRMGKIAMSLTDVITISAPTEVGEDPGTMISKIEEDLESYTKKFEQLKSQYEDTFQKTDEILIPQNK